MGSVPSTMVLMTILPDQNFRTFSMVHTRIRITNGILIYILIHTTLLLLNIPKKIVTTNTVTLWMEVIIFTTSMTFLARTILIRTMKNLAKIMTKNTTILGIEVTMFTTFLVRILICTTVLLNTLTKIMTKITTILGVELTIFMVNTTLTSTLTPHHRRLKIITLIPRMARIINLFRNHSLLSKQARMKSKKYRWMMKWLKKI